MRSDLGDGPGVTRPVVVDQDAGPAGYEDHAQRYNDVDVGHGALQLGETLAVEVEQQGHHAQGQHRGAGRHHDAGVGGRRGRECHGPKGRENA